MPEFLIANDDEIGPVATLQKYFIHPDTGADYGDVDFTEQGEMFAKWLAWNSTSNFIDGFLKVIETELDAMEQRCENIEEPALAELDPNGFPVV